MVIFNFCLLIFTQVFLPPLLRACKCIPHAKYQKHPIEISFSFFFHNTGPNLTQILSQRPAHFTFFADFQWNMLEDSISIDKLCCNSVVLKRSWLVKPLINCFIGPNLHKKGVIMCHTKNGKQIFLADITKEDHQLSKKKFY